MKNMKKRGFTLVEVMTVVGILGILASVILVNMNSAKTKSSDNKTFAEFSKSQNAAFSCMTSGSDDSILGFPPTMWGNPICYKTSPSLDARSEFPNWPALPAGDWKYSWCSGDDINNCFYFCSPGYFGQSQPSNCSSPLSAWPTSTCGGKGNGGSFCYALRNGEKYIWCTENGCKKEGF